MIYSGLYGKLVNDPTVGVLLAAPAKKSVFFNLADKEAKRPYVVIDIISQLSETTLYGNSDLQDGRIQFSSYADDQMTARRVSSAIRKLLEDYSGTLPDGSIIQFVETNLDLDDAYEEGGTGVVHRCILDISAFYTEASPA